MGATRATSLQRVANRPIICHVIDALADAGVLDVAVVAPNDVTDEIALCIERDGSTRVRITHLTHDPRDAHNTALAQISEFVGDAASILHRADGLLGQSLQPFLSLFAQRGEVALLLLAHSATPHLRLLPTARLPGAATRVSTEASPSDTAAVCLLSAGALSHLPADSSMSQPLDFAAIAHQLAQAAGHALQLPARRWRHFSGDVLDLLALNRTLLDALQSDAPAHAQHDNRFEGQIAIAPTATVKSSVIVGPVVIGADAYISDSYIGPHTAIAERVRIEGAEVERSIVLADASVLNVGGRLVASILGCHARIFRDFSVPRALRLHVSDGDEVALC